MAKSSQGTTSSGSGRSYGRLGSLCTAAERKLLELSESSALAKAGHAEVQALLTRARAARDKWRDLVGQQTRVVKRTPKAVAEANARSRDKAELFDGAVKRLETHLGTLAETVAHAAAPVKKSPAGRGKQPKRARVAGNRSSRAGLRAELAEAVSQLNRKVAKPTAAKSAARPVAATRGSAAVAAAKPAPAPAKTVVAGTSAAAATKRKRPPVAAAQAVRFDGAKQRSARTAAKNSRLKMEGLLTRRGGHVQASGKRSQARRDKRR